MTPTLDITIPDNMLALQGDKVLVYNRDAKGTGGVVLAHMLTIVRVIDGVRQELRLINRESKSGKPDWLLTQPWCDSLRPADTNKVGAKWQVTLKAKA